MYTREQLLATPEHSQFLLMNASKSDDYYAQYSGVALEDLLDELLLGSATGVTVYAPDGFSQYHPLYPDPALYHVFGDYSSIRKDSSCFWPSSERGNTCAPPPPYCHHHRLCWRHAQLCQSRAHDYRR